MAGSKSMWAFQMAGPSRLERIEAPVPDERELRAGQVLLKFVAGGICGSDLPYFKGISPADHNPEGGPHVRPFGSPLHEIVGEVVASRDPDLRVGALVVGWASLSNGLTEYIVSDGEGLFEYDPRFPPAAAIMMQPLACVISALNRVAGVPGSTAAVIGQGPIGVLFSHVLKSSGAAHVTGIDRVDRSEVAHFFGVDAAVHASSDRWAASLTEGGDRPNIVIETVGHQVTTMRDAVNALAFEGHLYYFGIPDDAIYPFPMNTFLRKNARLTSGITRDRKLSLSRANDYLKASPELVEAYITHVFDLDSVQAAFDLAVHPAPRRLKVVITSAPLD
jgi:threonine dehydrogenase-like Zn-dependent dehydrogenase